jgi:predicted signal transduction protein with EAL and GGDEF domain
MSVSILRSVIELGHNLGLRVVAEGVENREAWDKLLTLGCDLVQGNYLCSAIPPNELTRWFRESDFGPFGLGGNRQIAESTGAHAEEGKTDQPSAEA